MPYRRTAKPYMGLLALPPKGDITGPMCLTCREPVPYEEVVEGYPGRHDFCRVLVRCHGAEEVVRFDFDTVEWDHRDLKSLMLRIRYFDPLGNAEDDKLQA